MQLQSMMFVIFGISFAAFVVAIFVIVVFMLFKTWQRLRGVNCLYWTHPDNDPEGNGSCNPVHLPTLKEVTAQMFAEKGWHLDENYYLKKNKEGLTIKTYEDRVAEAKKEFDKVNIVPDNAPTWYYKESWWQWWSIPVKWVYEKKTTDDGKVAYSIVLFDPDDWLNTEVTTSELAENIDWSDCKPIYKFKQALLEKAAYAAPVLMGIACIGATFMLSIYLKG